MIVAQRLVGRGVLYPHQGLSQPRALHTRGHWPEASTGGLYRRILLLPHQPQGLAQQVQAAAKGILHEPNFVVKHGPRWLLRLVLFRHGRIVVAGVRRWQTDAYSGPLLVVTTHAPEWTATVDGKVDR